MRAVTLSCLSFLGLVLATGVPAGAQTLPPSASTMAESPEVKKAID